MMIAIFVYMLCYYTYFIYVLKVIFVLCIVPIAIFFLIKKFDPIANSVCMLNRYTYNI